MGEAVYFGLSFMIRPENAAMSSLIGGIEESDRRISDLNALSTKKTGKLPSNFSTRDDEPRGRGDAVNGLVVRFDG